MKYISPHSKRVMGFGVFFFKKKKLIRLQRGLVTEGNEEGRIIQGGKEKEKYKIK
jgi:hypothetical protein